MKKHDIEKVRRRGNIGLPDLCTEKRRKICHSCSKYLFNKREKSCKKYEFYLPRESNFQYDSSDRLPKAIHKTAADHNPKNNNPPCHSYHSTCYRVFKRKQGYCECQKKKPYAKKRYKKIRFPLCTVSIV